MRGTRTKKERERNAPRRRSGNSLWLPQGRRQRILVCFLLLFRFFAFFFFSFDELRVWKRAPRNSTQRRGDEKKNVWKAQIPENCTFTIGSRRLARQYEMMKPLLFWHSNKVEISPSAEERIIWDYRHEIYLIGATFDARRCWLVSQQCDGWGLNRRMFGLFTVLCIDSSGRWSKSYTNVQSGEKDRTQCW